MFYRFIETVQLALRCLGANLLRSLLTLLGIIIGVASVIFMMSVTAGASREILNEMEQLGLRNIILNSVEPAGADIRSESPSQIKQYGLLTKDIEQIRETCEDIEFVSRAQEVREEVWLGGRRIPARVLGVEPSYFSALRLDYALGRPLTDLDVEHAETVCCVGSQLLDQERIVQDPLTLQFKIRDLLFTVVGVLDQPQYTDYNLKALATSPNLMTIYIPSRTALRHFGTTYLLVQEGSFGGVSVEVDQAIVGVKAGGNVLDVAASIRQILERNHPRSDFEMVVPLERLRQREKAQRVFGITMVLVASISLVVGGIGIINIMLATVTERTREIGIRRACGAKRRHIAYQFLIETTTLSFVGGVIGALTGIGGVHIIAPRLHWPAIVTPESLALALGISCAVGIMFGTYPAVKASRMDPIEALRFE